jgi:hypothetical protein
MDKEEGEETGVARRVQYICMYIVLPTHGSKLNTAQVLEYEQSFEDVFIYGTDETHEFGPFPPCASRN